MGEGRIACSTVGEGRSGGKSGFSEGTGLAISNLPPGAVIRRCGRCIHLPVGMLASRPLNSNHYNRLAAKTVLHIDLRVLLVRLSPQTTIEPTNLVGESLSFTSHTQLGSRSQLSAEYYPIAPSPRTPTSTVVSSTTMI